MDEITIGSPRSSSSSLTEYKSEIDEEPIFHPSVVGTLNDQHNPATKGITGHDTTGMTISAVETGDLLLFCSNTPTGFLLRTFVSSQWNHVGVAVRFKSVKPPVISLDQTGDLYVLETNTGSRIDDIYAAEVVGCGFTRFDQLRDKYNMIAVRKLQSQLRTVKLGLLTLEFVDRNRFSPFPSSSMPFLGVWLGIPLSDKLSNEMFCSELIAHYYTYTIGGQYYELTGGPYDNNLQTLFGRGCPVREDLFTPEHYTHYMLPEAPIFDGYEFEVFNRSADLMYIILQPLLIALVVMLVVAMSLRNK